MDGKTFDGCDDRPVRITITGINPPGSSFCRDDGSPMDNVHVGVQIRRDPAQLIRADEPKPRWEVEVDVVANGGAVDFRGPAVQGKKGDRFVYLTWVNLEKGSEFEMFRRAKLMLNRVPTDLIEAAAATGCLEAVVDLTDDEGGTQMRPHRSTVHQLVGRCWKTTPRRLSDV